MAELLYKLREWLTVPDAAAHLSIVFGEEVTEADVMRLGLDGHLTLSVSLVNLTHGLLGRLVSRAQAETRRSEVFGAISEHQGDVDVSDTKVLQFNQPDRVVVVDGVWDLPMFGNEREEVQSRLQELVGGPSLTVHGSAGTFMTRPDGTWFQYFDREASPEHPDVGFPLAGLPDDAVLVVRTAALDDLKARLSESSSPHAGKASAMDKPLLERERLSLLKIIQALAKEAKIDVSRPSKAAEVIAVMTERIEDGRVAPRTIAGHLKKIQQEL